MSEKLVNAALVVGGLGGGTVAAFTVVGIVVRPLRRLVTQHERFWSVWLGHPASPGRPARAGFPDRMTAVEDEVRANGETMRRVEGRLEAVERKLSP